MRLTIIICILLLQLHSCTDPVTGVPDYDSRTSRYTCPAGQYEDLSTDGRQICRERR